MMALILVLILRLNEPMCFVSCGLSFKNCADVKYLSVPFALIL